MFRGEPLDAADFNDEAPRMPRRSKYAGQLIDVSSRHSVVICSGNVDESLILPSDRYVIADYFFHDGAYWTAKVPLDGLADVAGHSFNFSKPRIRKGKDGPEIAFDRNGLPKRKIPMLNHIQTRMRFRTETPIELYPQGHEPAGKPTHSIDDIVYSLEAVGPAGIRFNLRDALIGNLVSAHRFMSTKEMVFERLVVENQWITESPPLPLTEDEKRWVLTESLLSSHRAGMSESYYLFRPFGTNNCTSSPFHIVDRAVKYGFARRIGASLYRLPISPRLYLRIRGLDSDPTFRKLLRTEFEDYIRQPDIRERKREFLQSRKQNSGKMAK